MKTCKDCLHYRVCFVNGICDSAGAMCDGDDQLWTVCGYFADKSEWVHLPCKVGDTAYFITERNAPKGTKEHIVETTIEKIGVRGGGMFIKLSVNAMYETSCNSIGKTVFLTLEEAEKALAERSGK